MTKLNGVDISGWDEGINTTNLTADFVIVKATEGLVGTKYNPSYRDMANKAATSGKLIGFYHYANGEDPIEEAKCFYNAIKDYKGRAIACLDWESQGNPKFGKGSDVSWCKLFLDKIAELMDYCVPLLYTSKSECNAFDWSSVSIKYPLWGAEYADEKVHDGYLSDPWQSSKPWGSWGARPAIHQWGYVNPKPHNGGISTGLDGDLLYGDAALWKTWCGASQEKPVERTRINVADIAARIHYDMVTDERNGYSQDPRYGKDHPDGNKTLTIYGRKYTYPLGSYDCSSSVIVAWQLALKYTKYEGVLDDASYTGDMKEVFVKSGLFKASLTPAKRGDLYLNEGVHVAMCQDGGSDGVFGYDCLSEFNRNELHRATGGKVGDQDGYESVVREYYNDDWNTVLHYIGDIELYDASKEPSDNKTDIGGDIMAMFIYPEGVNKIYYWDGSPDTVPYHLLPSEKSALDSIKAYTIPTVKMSKEKFDILMNMCKKRKAWLSEGIAKDVRALIDTTSVSITNTASDK